MYTCSVCGYTSNLEWQTCPRCGCVRNGGANPMGFMLWFLLILTIPVYPIAGGGALVSALTFVFIVDLLGLNPIVWMIGLMIVPVVAYMYAFKWEQRAAHIPAYRTARWGLRVAACGAANYYMVFGNSGFSGGEMFGVMVATPLVLLLVKMADIALDVRGTPVEVPRLGWRKYFTLSDEARDYLIELKWNEALIYGYPFGVLGFLIGQDTRILFGLFLWALVSFGILGTKILFRLLGTGLREGTRLAGAANRGLGGFPRRILFGIGGGAATGAVLGQILDGRVQIEAVIITAVLGFIISLVYGAVFRRRAS